MVPSQKPLCGTSLPARRIYRECFFSRAMPDMPAYCRNAVMSAAGTEPAKPALRPKGSYSLEKADLGDPSRAHGAMPPRRRAQR